MILVAETTWTGTVHAPGNSATVQTVAAAFPGRAVRVVAEPSHLAELRRDPALAACANVDFRPIAVSPLFPGKTHVVSTRRFLHELRSLRAVLRDVPPAEPCLLFLISATPTAIAAASLLARVRRGRTGVQVGLHGNLNEIAGWRPRNPLARRFDLAAVLGGRQPGFRRYLVLEPSIRDALAAISPAAARRTDVLPLPVNAAESPDAAGEPPPAPPVRIGFVGQGTAAKGFDVFVAIARALKAAHGDRVAFHLVGRTVPGTDSGPLASVLAEPASDAHLPRAEFLRRLARLHYVLLPFRPGYYDLSASGALLDAVTWLKPVIALDVPLVRQFAAAHGEIGFLCKDGDALREAVDAAIAAPDGARYAAQVAALARARAARQPACLARVYRQVVRDGFPGLLE